MVTDKPSFQSPQTTRPTCSIVITPTSPHLPNPRIAFPPQPQPPPLTTTIVRTPSHKFNKMEQKTQTRAARRDLARRDRLSYRIHKVASTIAFRKSSVTSSVISTWRTLLFSENSEFDRTDVTNRG